MPSDCCNRQQGIVSGSWAKLIFLLFATFKDINCWFAFSSTDLENSLTVFFFSLKRNWNLKWWKIHKMFESSTSSLLDAARRRVRNQPLSFLNMAINRIFFFLIFVSLESMPNSAVSPATESVTPRFWRGKTAACHRYSKPQGLVSREIPPASIHPWFAFKCACFSAFSPSLASPSYFWQDGEGPKVKMVQEAESETVAEEQPNWMSVLFWNRVIDTIAWLLHVEWDRAEQMKEHAIGVCLALRRRRIDVTLWAAN